MTLLMRYYTRLYYAIMSAQRPKSKRILPQMDILTFTFTVLFVASFMIDLEPMCSWLNCRELSQLLKMSEPLAFVPMMFIPCLTRLKVKARRDFIKRICFVSTSSVTITEPNFIGSQASALKHCIKTLR